MTKHNVLIISYKRFSLHIYATANYFDRAK